MENKPMSEKKMPAVLQPLFERIKDGKEENWDYFDANLGPQHLTLECVTWARKHGLIDSNEHIRDASATVIAHSDEPLSEVDMAWLIGPMTEDDNPFVRYWLANALYKRGDRDPEVVAMWEEACKQNSIPAGEFARSLITSQ
jgi:hypothetical protein